MALTSFLESMLREKQSNNGQCCYSLDIVCDNAKLPTIHLQRRQKRRLRQEQHQRNISNHCLNAPCSITPEIPDYLSDVTKPPPTRTSSSTRLPSTTLSTIFSPRNDEKPKLRQVLSEAKRFASPTFIKSTKATPKPSPISVMDATFSPLSPRTARWSSRPRLGRHTSDSALSCPERFLNSPKKLSF